MKAHSTDSNARQTQFDEWTKAIARQPARRKSLQLLGGGLFGALLTSLARKSWAASSTPTGTQVDIAPAAAQKGLSICRNQEYALCAGVRCFVYNSVAYCRCNLLFGDSVSRKLSYPGGDVCTFNAAGAGNGFVVSTFSVPPSSVGGSGDRALYFCPPSPASGAYASCDGGVCFSSTRGQSFPGLGRLGQDQIVCSCTIASGSADKAGHQIYGPKPCQTTFFDNCKSTVATGENGTYLYEAAPTGSYEIGAVVLNGVPARFNMCFP